MKCGDGPEEASHASEAPVSPAPAAVPTTITTQASRCRQCSEEPVHLPWQVPSRARADGPGAASHPGTGAEGAQQSFSLVSSSPGRFTDPFIQSVSDLHWGPACSQVDRINAAFNQASQGVQIESPAFLWLGTRKPGMVRPEAMALVLMSGQPLKSPTAWRGGARLRGPVPRCPEPQSV